MKLALANILLFSIIGSISFAAESDPAVHAFTMSSCKAERSYCFAVSSPKAYPITGSQIYLTDPTVTIYKADKICATYSGVNAVLNLANMNLLLHKNRTSSDQVIIDMHSNEIIEL